MVQHIAAHTNRVEREVEDAVPAVLVAVPELPIPGVNACPGSVHQQFLAGRDSDVVSRDRWRKVSGVDIAGAGERAAPGAGSLSRAAQRKAVRGKGGSHGHHRCARDAQIAVDHGVAVAQIQVHRAVTAAAEDDAWRR